MDVKDLIIGIVFLFQSTIGILGNFYLLCYYLILYFIKQKLKTKDLIFTYLFTETHCLLFLKVC